MNGRGKSDSPVGEEAGSTVRFVFTEGRGRCGCRRTDPCERFRPEPTASRPSIPSGSTELV